MYRQIKALLTILLFCLLLPVFSFAGAHGGGHTGPDPKGPAILLVTFGTSVPSAKASFDNIDKLTKEAFPKVEVRWAYTSSIIRNKLAKQGTMIDSPEVALAKLMAEGYSKVAVQSLHMIPGAEFHDTYVNAKMFGDMVGGFEKIIVSYPLLASNENMDRVVDLIIANIIPKTRTKDEAVVLMGHGTHHTSDAIYSAMMYKFQKKDTNIYVGTIEGNPTFDEVKEMLVTKGTKKAYLIPLMSVAGDHSINDMSGPEDDSWLNMLKAIGIESIAIQKGVAEYDALANVWIDNLKNAMKHLQ